MTFHYSAEDIRVDDGHILRARLQRGDGEWQDAEIDLDQFIGNIDGMWHNHTRYVFCTNNAAGHFSWDGENFSHTAQGAHFAIEGDGSVPVLRAELFDAEGNAQTRDVNLAERISNNDGQFNFSMLYIEDGYGQSC
jgi:hypothetical protein